MSQTGAFLYQMDSTIQTTYFDSKTDALSQTACFEQRNGCAPPAASRRKPQWTCASLLPYAGKGKGQRLSV